MTRTSKLAVRGTSLKTANLSTTRQKRERGCFVGHDWNISGAAVAEADGCLDSPGILLRPCEIAVQSTPEDDAINKGSCVFDPPSPRPGKRKKEKGAVPYPYERRASTPLLRLTEWLVGLHYPMAFIKPSSL